MQLLSKNEKKMFVAAAEIVVRVVLLIAAKKMREREKGEGGEEGDQLLLNRPKSLKIYSTHTHTHSNTPIRNCLQNKAILCLKLFMSFS